MERAPVEQTMWVFGYGSLMWRPGFEFAERRPALLRGLHRSLCVISHVHRGTPERPGLVAGLDRGGACRGVAFRVREGAEDEVRGYLRAREQPTMVYRETIRAIDLAGDGAPGARVDALCFIVDRAHHQYGRGLGLPAQVDLVVNGVGRSGTSIDYLADLVASLERAGITDTGLARLWREVEARAGTRSRPSPPPAALTGPV